MHDAVYDQLRHLKPELNRAKVKEIALYLGQTRFSAEQRFWEVFLELDKHETTEIFDATVDYTITFGVMNGVGNFTVVANISEALPNENRYCNGYFKWYCCFSSFSDAYLFN